MTLNEIATQLHEFSVGGYFNHQKYTKEDLRRYLKLMLRGDKPDPLVMEIALPNGWWYFQINKRNPERDGFDYTIPETREQEAEIKADLIRRYKEMR
jgi:hypothetical protein